MSYHAMTKKYLQIQFIKKQVFRWIYIIKSNLKNKICKISFDQCIFLHYLFQVLRNCLQQNFFKKKDITVSYKVHIVSFSFLLCTLVVFKVLVSKIWWFQTFLLSLIQRFVKFYQLYFLLIFLEFKRFLKFIIYHANISL